ncbi:MAG: hypothetical protein I4O49_05625 [Janthinobacterium lividum]|nr:hypothetical protein [Janthinobacterium lividum]
MAIVQPSALAPWHPSRSEAAAIVQTRLALAGVDMEEESLRFLSYLALMQRFRKNNRTATATLVVAVLAVMFSVQLQAASAPGYLLQYTSIYCYLPPFAANAAGSIAGPAHAGGLTRRQADMLTQPLISPLISPLTSPIPRPSRARAAQPP